MKTLLLFFGVTVVLLFGGCSKNGSEAGQAAMAVEELPEQEVVDIVNAVNGKNVAQAGALLKKNPKLVGATFENGGPVNGWPLLVIAASNNDKAMVELLLRSGADVNAVNYSGEAAIHYAVVRGAKEIVGLLIAKKAEVNAKTEIGVTPLKTATSSGKNDIAAMLKAAGAK